jgi:DNA-binding response OmpR family regulator
MAALPMCRGEPRSGFIFSSRLMNGSAGLAVRSMAHQTTSVSGSWRQIGPLAVLESRRLVRVADAVVRLTRAEMALLAMLIEAAPEPVARETLLRATRLRPVLRAHSRLADQRVYTLRRKLGDDGRWPELIVSVPGVGYALDVDRG